MRSVRSWLLVAVALLALAGVATAQTTNGTISGHITDAQGLALPGVTVNATSPNLQGVRTVGDDRERRLRAVAAAVRNVHRHVRVERVPDGQ